MYHGFHKNNNKNTFSELVIIRHFFNRVLNRFLKDHVTLKTGVRDTEKISFTITAKNDILKISYFKMQ